MPRRSRMACWAGAVRARGGAGLGAVGTVGGVLAYLADNRIQVGIRLREGPDQGELAWRRPSRAMIENMLRNPAYAGIYAYGRSAGDPRKRRPGRPYSGKKRVEPGQWLVCLPGILPSYISVEQYERNVRRMDANRSRAQGMGAVRDGPALLAGLVRCGRCGRKMTVRYQRGPGGALQPSYVCGMAAATWAEERCQQLAGPCVDDYASGLALQAMAPAALEVSLAAAEQEEQRRAETDRIWRQRLERADYTADRARDVGTQSAATVAAAAASCAFFACPGRRSRRVGWCRRAGGAVQEYQARAPAEPGTGYSGPARAAQAPALQAGATRRIPGAGRHHVPGGPAGARRRTDGRQSGRRASAHQGAGRRQPACSRRARPL